MIEKCDGKSGDGITHHMACECREKMFSKRIEFLEAELDNEMQANIELHGRILKLESELRKAVEAMRKKKSDIAFNPNCARED